MDTGRTMQMLKIRNYCSIWHVRLHGAIIFPAMVRQGNAGFFLLITPCRSRSYSRACWLEYMVKRTGPTDTPLALVLTRNRRYREGVGNFPPEESGSGAAELGKPSPSPFSVNEGAIQEIRAVLRRGRAWPDGMHPGRARSRRGEGDGLRVRSHGQGAWVQKAVELHAGSDAAHTTYSCTPCPTSCPKAVFPRHAYGRSSSPQGPRA